MKIIFFLFVTINALFAITNLQTQQTKIVDLNKTTATINIANLKIGQSGVVVKSDDKNSIVLTQAIIINSNKNNSTIKFITKQILQQEAIPTSNLTPQNGDTFILNHLYNTSLLLVPNLKVKNNIENLYPKQNFLDEDFFAAHLKLKKEPIPTKKTIQKFAQSQQIGTIFIAIQNKLYILDSNTFKIIDTIEIQNDDKSTNVPFLTKIKDIELGLWDFGNEKIENYNKYYLKLLEIK